VPKLGRRPDFGLLIISLVGLHSTKMAKNKSGAFDRQMSTNFNKGTKKRTRFSGSVEIAKLQA